MSTADQEGTPPAETLANPRGFVMATGILFQSVGCLLMLGGCFLWTVSGHVVAPDKAPPDSWLGYFSSRTSAAAWTIGVATGFISGLALAAIGIGLHGERPSSGRLGAAATAIAAAIFAVVGGVLVVGESRWGAAMLPIALAGAMLIFCLFALRSAYLLKRFPPPAHTEATEEVLDEIRRRRQARREYYDR